MYGVFIDLRYAYNAMDRERCLEILKAYGVGPKMLRLLRYIWDNTERVCCTGVCHGKPFKAYQVATQGGPFSSHIFNVIVDAIVREWLHQVMGDDAARLGMGANIDFF